MKVLNVDFFKRRRQPSKMENNQPAALKGSGKRKNDVEG